MKRNWDLIRNILLKIKNYTVIRDEFTDEMIKHMRLLEHSGYVIYERNNRYDLICYATMKGYDLLELMGSDEEWNLIKNYISDNQLPFTEETIKLICKKIVHWDLN